MDSNKNLSLPDQVDQLFRRALLLDNEQTSDSIAKAVHSLDQLMALLIQSNFQVKHIVYAEERVEKVLGKLLQTKDAPWRMKLVQLLGFPFTFDVMFNTGSFEQTVSKKLVESNGALLENLFKSGQETSSSADYYPLVSELLGSVLVKLMNGPHATPASQQLVFSLWTKLNSLLEQKDSSKTYNTVAILASFVKLVDSKEGAKSFSQHTIFKTLLNLVDSTVEKASQMVAVILSKMFENVVNDDDRKPLIEVLSSTVLTSVDSEKKLVKIKGLTLLMSIFQANLDIGAGVFQQDQVIQNIIDDLEFESNDVQILALDVFSLACSNKKCRAVIDTRAGPFIRKCANKTVPESESNSSSQRMKTTAGLILTKLQIDNGATVPMDGNTSSPSSNDAAPAVDAFISTILNPTAPLNQKVDAVEGLAFATLSFEVKEKVANNEKLMKELCGELAKQNHIPLQYGIATVLANLTNYPRRLSEEEAQIQKLKEFAKEVPKRVVNAKDTDAATEVRGLEIVARGGITCLVTICKTARGNIREAVSNVFCNLATNQKNRGHLVAQGAVKSLLTLTSKSHNTPNGTIAAAHALAKIAISTDPNIAFKGERALELVRPLIELLKDTHELRQFESLLALTNLASMENSAVRSKIVHINNESGKTSGLREIEFLQFSENKMVRRAATEAICNLLFEPSVYAKYSEDAPDSSRIRIFVALADVEDFETRRAASGVLALLSSHPKVCQFILDEKHGLEVLMNLLKDSDEELQHRAAECISNMAEVSQEMVTVIEKAGFVEVLKAIGRKSKNPVLVPVVAAALKNLQRSEK